MTKLKKEENAKVSNLVEEMEDKTWLRSLLFCQAGLKPHQHIDDADKQEPLHFFNICKLDLSPLGLSLSI
jgi:hypothetical protein